MCEGTGIRQYTHDHAKLVERCEELLKFPLTAQDRDYVHDLMRRIDSGLQPILVDWFRSRELVSKYTGRPVPSLNGPRKRRA